MKEEKGHGNSNFKIRNAFEKKYTFSKIYFDKVDLGTPSRLIINP